MDLESIWNDNGDIIVITFFVVFDVGFSMMILNYTLTNLYINFLDYRYPSIDYLLFKNLIAIKSFIMAMAIVQVTKRTL